MCGKKVGGVIEEQRGQMMCCRENPLSLRRSVATQQTRGAMAPRTAAIGLTQALGDRYKDNMDPIKGPGDWLRGHNDLLCVNWAMSLFAGPTPCPQ